ncbi:protein of unknown function [Aminobacter niigataensis]|nr:protein of unknown function [Aminobacter niigataensis]
MGPLASGSLSFALIGPLSASITLPTGIEVSFISVFAGPCGSLTRISGRGEAAAAAGVGDGVSADVVLAWGASSRLAAAMGSSGVACGAGWDRMLGAAAAGADSGGR